MIDRVGLARAAASERDLNRKQSPSYVARLAPLAGLFRRYLLPVAS